MHYFDPKYWRNFSVESEKLKFFLESKKFNTHAKASNHVSSFYCLWYNAWTAAT